MIALYNCKCVNIILNMLLKTIFTAEDIDCIYFSFFDYRKKKNEIKNVAG